MTVSKKIAPMRWLSAAVLATTLAGCQSMGGTAPAGNVSLSGAAEVPAVTTMAVGTGNIRVGADRTVTGSVTTTGVNATMAHIHMAPKGSNGPVVVPLTKTAEGVWSVPDGIRLNDTQYAGYIAGNMYVNVHSAAHPGGEIRGQLNAK